MRIRPLIFGTIIAFASLMGIATAQERTMIVLDGSGSMWGQIDGVPKLQIARDTLRDVLASVPETTELGFMAYGHRRKGDCGDIELIVAPALGMANTIADKADSMKFLGKTPLSAAVKRAAEELRYTEDTATVVLITDGLETCSANVCELGQQLEAQGANFTAHVVGFGLSKEEGAQVACLAENTGGQYFSADNADALSAALKQTVVAIVPSVTLVPVDQDGAKITDISLTWSVLDPDGNEVMTDSGFGKATGKLNAGNFTVSVSGPEASGGGAIEIVADIKSQNFEIPLEIIRLTATVEAPAEVAAGAEFEVIWDGPADKSDYVTIVEKGADEGVYNDYAYTQNGNPSKIIAPDGLGAYEVRYVHGQTRKTLGSADIEVVAITGSVVAPAQVAAGAEFEVDWTGPAYKTDYITIVEVGAEEGTYKDYAYAKNANPAKIQAPDGLGEYEVRYVIGASKRTLASTKIEVTAVSGTLEAPESVPAGSEFEVIWTGPANKSDYITIVEIGAPDGTYKDYAYAQNGSPAKISAPDAIGNFELRYVLATSDRTLVSRPISTTQVSATLELMGPAIPGGEIKVNWTGPNAKSDYITVVEIGADEGSYNDYAYTQNGSPAKIKLPKALGTFEIRYVIGSSDRTLASLQIALKPASASISAPAVAKAGDAIEVSWTGPAAKGDTIEIVGAGASANETPLGNAGTVQGSPLFIYAPEEAGDYEVRYKVKSTGEVLATAPLKID